LHKDTISSFYVKLLTDKHKHRYRQTDRQTNQQTPGKTTSLAGLNGTS